MNRVERRTVEELDVQIIEQNERRKHFERTPEQLAEQIKEEAQELVDEIQTSLVTGEVFNIVGEIGDLYILLAQLCHELGINPAHARQFKQYRNERKYPDHTMNNGFTREESVRLSKETWKASGGDKAFSYIYLEHIAGLVEEEVGPSQVR